MCQWRIYVFIVWLLRSFGMLFLFHGVELTEEWYGLEWVEKDGSYGL